MKNFSRGGGFGGKRSGGFGHKDSGRGGFGGGRPSMHKVTCSDCGRSCEVPFRPTGDRPVYCDSCFRENSGSRQNGSERKFRDRDSERPKFEANNQVRENKNQYQEQFNALNAKLDKILEMLKPAKVETEKAVKTESDKKKVAVKKVKEDEEKKETPKKSVVKKAAAKGKKK